MSKSILAIMGSPRATGLTAALLKIFQEKVEELNKGTEAVQQIKIDILMLKDFVIQHCTGCDACLRKPNECPLSEKDDMKKVEEAMLKADAIIIGAPSYFAGMPGIVKDLIDRTRPMKMQKYLLKNKYFSVITATGLQGGGQNSVQDDLIHFALIQGMIVVGALGHPVLMPNFPNESLQMLELKKFRKPNEPGEIANTTTANLAQRIWDLLS